MKITVDETVFNKAILQRKLEAAKWLIDQGCPTNHYCYFQILEIDVLNWLFDCGIIIDKDCLFDVIQKTSDREIISWFCSKGVIADSKCVNSCIKSNNLELLEWLMQNNNILLTTDNYKTAISTETSDILDYLKTNACPYDETVLEYALKNSKKESLKWLVHNNFF